MCDARQSTTGDRHPGLQADPSHVHSGTGLETLDVCLTSEAVMIIDEALLLWFVSLLEEGRAYRGEARRSLLEDPPSSSRPEGLSMLTNGRKKKENAARFVDTLFFSKYREDT